MTSRPPPRTRSTRSRCSVSTSRNSISARPSRRANATAERGHSPGTARAQPWYLPCPAPCQGSQAPCTNKLTPEPVAQGPGPHPTCVSSACQAGCCQ